MKSTILAIALLLSPCSVALALDSFSLSLQSAELVHLQVGEPLTIDVILAGLPAGASLEYVAATVAFDGSLLGTPTIVLGNTVPDPTGFTSAAQPGLADALYDSLAASSGSALSQAGILFSFSVTPLATGTGVLRFDFADALGMKADGVLIDGLPASDPIPFVVETPEPSTVSLVAITSAILGRWRRRRRT